MTTPTPAQIEARLRNGVLSQVLNIVSGNLLFEAANTIVALTAAAEAGSTPVRRVLDEADAFCPSCGHNRDRSSVSSIDHGGFKECQKCGVHWHETAAAEVDDKPPGYHEAMQAAHRIAAAAAVGESVGWTHHSDRGEISQVKAAAEVGRPVAPYTLDEIQELIEHKNRLERLLNEVANERTSTIERCVQVVEDICSTTGMISRDYAVARLRALKDKPVVEEWPHLNVAIENKP